MLAKKASEKAKKEFEDRLAREAEDRRLSAIPKWKRDLIARKEEAEHKFKWVFTIFQLKDFIGSISFADTRKMINRINSYNINFKSLLHHHRRQQPIHGQKWELHNDQWA
jgi:hypothetical protein